MLAATHPQRYIRCRKVSRYISPGVVVTIVLLGCALLYYFGGLRGNKTVVCTLPVLVTSVIYASCHYRDREKLIMRIGASYVLWLAIFLPIAVAAQTDFEMPQREYWFASAGMAFTSFLWMMANYREYAIEFSCTECLIEICSSIGALVAVPMMFHALDK